MGVRFWILLILVDQRPEMYFGSGSSVVKVEPTINATLIFLMMSCFTCRRNGISNRRALERAREMIAIMHQVRVVYLHCLGW